MGGQENEKLREREMGDGRRETGDGRRETGDGRRETGDGRRETGDGRRETGDGRRETGDGRQETGDGRWETGDGRLYIFNYIQRSLHKYWDALPLRILTTQMPHPHTDNPPQIWSFQEPACCHEANNELPTPISTPTKEIPTTEEEEDVELDHGIDKISHQKIGEGMVFLVVFGNIRSEIHEITCKNKGLVMQVHQHFSTECASQCSALKEAYALSLFRPSSLKVIPWFFIVVLTPFHGWPPMVPPQSWFFLTVLVLPRGPGISSWSWSFFMVVALCGSGSGPYFLVYPLFLIPSCFHLL
ncbi:hypothetical protein C8R48DRAFT_803338 [Suillus tomentosus]|nr:hypothetical protein C8R48DRAFT_803338 [Suillus tomentosus]